eukprot:3941568-Rhodomonas_salina.3
MTQPVYDSAVMRKFLDDLSGQINPFPPRPQYPLYHARANPFNLAVQLRYPLRQVRYPPTQLPVLTARVVLPAFPKPVPVLLGMAPAMPLRSRYALYCTGSLYDLTRSVVYWAIAWSYEPSCVLRARL